MKRLNRKGFTLVELLAVIVILAIVVGITLVTILPTLKKSRQEAFELTAQTAADFVEKQYQLSLIGEATTLASFPTTATALTSTQVQAAGLKPENYVYGTYQVNSSTGRACVKLYASTKITEGAKVNTIGSTTSYVAGEYYDATEGTETTLKVPVNGAAAADTTLKYSVAVSSGCTE